MSGSSIRFQLSLRFGLLALIGVLIAAYAITRQIRHLDDLVQEVALGHQIEDLANALGRDADGMPTLDLPPRLLRLYEEEHNGSVFVIRNQTGQVLFDDGDNALKILEPGFTFPSFFHYFQAVDMSPEEARGLDPQRFGMTERVNTDIGEVFITVAQHRVADDFLSRAVAIELVDDAILVGGPLLILFILAGFGVVSYSTRGLSFLSEKARDIGPQTIRTRLPVHAAPTEVMPLAHAFNEAMDRVAEGYDNQQRFTIDAAHQLKTPLAVLRARLETIAPFAGRDLLEVDLSHMETLIQQLLTSARISVVNISPDETITLNALAQEVVVALAPIAIEQGNTLELERPDVPVVVMGESHLAMEAIRNLVNNAINHTADGTTVTVRVSEPHKLQVLDRGPGVPDSEKKHIFMPFSQGRKPTRNGTGMGLAIVSQIMQVHFGKVTVEDRDGGGAVFTLHFSPPLVRQAEE